MNRYDPSPYGRTDFGIGGGGGGGSDFGLFGGGGGLGYSSSAMAPPPAVPAPFSAAPPSLMSLGSMAPPHNVAGSLQQLAGQQASYPPPAVVPPTSHLLSQHSAVLPPSMGGAIGGGGGGGAVAAGSAGMNSSGVNTNSRHPLAVKARVFVGNLNTNAVSRDEFEQLFRRFGEVLAVSMHRGYGFIQYSFEYEARNAISFTDGMVLGGQRLDVNLASEPKSGREVKTSKRQADTSVSESPTKRTRSITTTDSGKSSSSSSSALPKPLFPSKAPSNSGPNVELTGSSTTASEPAAKSTKTVVPSTNKISSITTTTSNSSSKSTANSIPVLTKKITSSADSSSPLITMKTTSNSSVLRTLTSGGTTTTSTSASTTNKADVNGAGAEASVPCTQAPGATESSPDILICGHCRSLFDNMASFTTHRKENPGKSCATKISTTSQQKTSVAVSKTGAGAGASEPDTLPCSVCQKHFDSSWNLIVHASKEHNVTIYGIGGKAAEIPEKPEPAKDKVSSNTNAAAAAVFKKEKEAEDAKTS